MGAPSPVTRPPSDAAPPDEEDEDEDGLVPLEAPPPLPPLVPLLAPWPPLPELDVPELEPPSSDDPAEPPPDVPSPPELELFPGAGLPAPLQPRAHTTKSVPNNKPIRIAASVPFRAGLADLSVSDRVPRISWRNVSVPRRGCQRECALRR